MLIVIYHRHGIFHFGQLRVAVSSAHSFGALMMTMKMIAIYVSKPSTCSSLYGQQMAMK